MRTRRVARWLVVGTPDELGRHYEGEAATRREAERLAAGWSGVIVDRRPRPRWSLGEFEGVGRQAATESAGPAETGTFVQSRAPSSGSWWRVIGSRAWGE